MDSLGAQVQAAGSPGVAVFVAIYAASTLLVLPKVALSIAAGLIYGFWPAIAIVLVAAMLGAVMAFALGRVLGRGAVERMAGAHLLRLDALVDRHGAAAIVLVRLIPLVPFTIINYAAGLTSIKFRSYSVGTLIGILP
ncbi:MAG: VTT domain-containing protein, partial [Gammaproteobacteria bacterium]|nr:VTT domain-containing protein [Gammaproteobacteria bacterium]